MENVFEITMLLDFSGQLLTQRQLEIMDLHYNDDLSLAEIAEQLEISRQGVFDNIKRGKATLIEFEDKLGLVKKFLEQKDKAESLLKELEQIEQSELSENNKKYLKSIECGLKEIVHDI